MKKVIILFVLIIYPAQILAGVNISCAQVGYTDKVQVSYVASDDANIPRAFGLDIRLDNDETITGIVDANEKYWVFPGTIQIVDGTITDEGTPVAPSSDPGALGGIDTNGMTIEMGSLYDSNDPEHQDGPPLAGTLLSFTVSGNCTITISANAARGGVVLEDGMKATTNLPHTCFLPSDECLKDTAPEYADWVYYGKPDCWCYQRQCRGDTDGLPLGPPVWVSQTDLDLMRLAINRMDTDPQWLPGYICADFNHQKLGPPVRVSQADLNILRTYINKMDMPTNTVVPPCDNNQDGILEADDKYNFWTNP